MSYRSSCWKAFQNLSLAEMQGNPVNPDLHILVSLKKNETLDWRLMSTDFPAKESFLTHYFYSLTFFSPVFREKCIFTFPGYNFIFGFLHFLSLTLEYTSTGRHLGYLLILFSLHLILSVTELLALDARRSL